MEKIDRGNFSSNIKFLEKIGLLTKGAKILEIGSGTGHLAKYLADLGYNIKGTEVNLEYISYAKRVFGIDLEYMKGDELSFKDQEFDMVLSFDVFEHIDNTDKHLKSVNRILKNKGYYLLQTPNKITNIPFEILKEKSLTKYKEYHCSLHSYRQIIRRFRKNNFNVKFIHVPTVNSYFKAKISKYSGNVGLFLIKILNPDKFPMWLKANFYIVAQKL